MKTITFKHYDNQNGGGCRVYENGVFVKGCTATGCGYDREGTAFGNWLEKNYIAKIAQIDNSKKEFYGLFKRSDGSIYLDGGCGFSSMEKIANAIGLKLHRLNIKSNSSNYYEIYEAGE